MPIALLKFPTDLLRDVFKFCDPFELFEKAEKKEDYFKGSMLKPISMQYPDEVVDLFFNLLDTFGICRVGMLSIDFRNFESFSKIANILIERNMEIEEFHIGSNRDVKDAVHIMPLVNRMNITQYFECDPRFLCRFHYQLETFPKKVFINWSYWFNIGQLLNNSCVRMELFKSNLSNQDLDVFLRKWKNAGTFPNLRWLKIYGKKIGNQSPILDMIPPIQIVGNPRVEVTFGYRKDIVDGVPISKDDGTVGWLKVELGGRWPEFKFLVVNPDDTVITSR
ncbi:unnamed protein product [Caenorhabditis nigoni]